MTPASLIAWRQRLRLSQGAAAAALGCSRRSFGSYERGTAPIPKYIALAAAAVEQEITPMRTQKERTIP